jgi:hypothetical protein
MSLRTCCVKDVSNGVQEILRTRKVLQKNRAESSEANELMLLYRSFQSIEVTIRMPERATTLALINPEQFGSRLLLPGQQCL